MGGAVWYEDQFQRFNTALKLDTERRVGIDRAVTRLIGFCDAEPELSIAKADNLFLEGSVSTGSVVKVRFVKQTKWPSGPIRATNAHPVMPNTGDGAAPSLRGHRKKLAKAQ